jgi:hypothetical protein
LKAEEMQKLREYPLCPSRKDNKKRMVVNQLYEPSRDLEKLDLPIISWPIDVTPLIPNPRITLSVFVTYTPHRSDGV